ncbi:unnamed protein product [Psylliodes chrysocephalus]|uniref:Uncharacterized protein n=1 Tax=Psylliodes chrysocephalus TaxID=3402493 RepID=A0A9P0D6U7_9CUCU|nr:unnamed protein product [Psylliodes chrysocephala]
MSWKEKHLYVSTPIKKEATQRSSNRKVEGASKRSCTYKFYLPKFEGIKLKVCKTIFGDTIAIKPWTITHWLNNNSQVIFENKFKYLQSSSTLNNDLQPCVKNAITESINNGDSSHNEKLYANVTSSTFIVKPKNPGQDSKVTKTNVLQMVNPVDEQLVVIKKIGNNLCLQFNEIIKKLKRKYDMSVEVNCKKVEDLENIMQCISPANQNVYFDIDKRLKYQLLKVQVQSRINILIAI